MPSGDGAEECHVVYILSDNQRIHGKADVASYACELSVEKCLKIDKIVLYYEYYRVIGDAPQSQRHPFYLERLSILTDKT